jgi:hypothetical protein
MAGNTPCPTPFPPPRQGVLARGSQYLAVVPQSAVTGAVLRPGESVRALPFASTLTLSLVTDQQPPTELLAARPVAHRLGLS